MTLPIVMTEMSLRRCEHFAGKCLAVLLCFGALVNCGCRGEVLGQVDGRVTLQGEPVRQGYVIFRNHAKGVHIMAEIDDEGRYHVAMAGGHGLPLGEYVVYLSPPVPDVPFGPAKEPPKPSEVAKFPEQYLQGETSGLQLTVQRGENPFDIDMTP